MEGEDICLLSCHVAGTHPTAAVSSAWRPEIVVETGQGLLGELFARRCVIGVVKDELLVPRGTKVPAGYLVVAADGPCSSFSTTVHGVHRADTQIRNAPAATRTSCVPPPRRA